MRFIPVFFISIVLIVFNLQSYAQQIELVDQQDSLKTIQNEATDLEIDAMVVDQTITKTGRDFYDIYYSKWQAPFGIKDYNIVIEEKPFPRLGTQITVFINEFAVYQGFIQPRYEKIEENVETSIRMTLDFLFNFEQIKKDLEGEDLTGSGIN